MNGQPGGKNHHVPNAFELLKREEAESRKRSRSNSLNEEGDSDRRDRPHFSRPGFRSGGSGGYESYGSATAYRKEERGSEGRARKSFDTQKDYDHPQYGAGSSSEDEDERSEESVSWRDSSKRDSSKTPMERAAAFGGTRFNRNRSNLPPDSEGEGEEEEGDEDDDNAYADLLSTADHASAISRERRDGGAETPAEGRRKAEPKLPKPLDGLHWTKHIRRQIAVLLANVPGKRVTKQRSGNGFVFSVRPASGAGPKKVYEGIHQFCARTFYPFLPKDDPFRGRKGSKPVVNDVPGSLPACKLSGKEHGISVHEQVEFYIHCYLANKVDVDRSFFRRYPEPDPCVRRYVALMRTRKLEPLFSEMPIVDDGLQVVTQIDQGFFNWETEAITIAELKTGYDDGSYEDLETDKLMLGPPGEWGIAASPKNVHLLQILMASAILQKNYGLQPGDYDAKVVRISRRHKRCVTYDLEEPFYGPAMLRRIYQFAFESKRAHIATRSRPRARAPESHPEEGGQKAADPLPDYHVYRNAEDDPRGKGKRSMSRIDGT